MSYLMRTLAVIFTLIFLLPASAFNPSTVVWPDGEIDFNVNFSQSDPGLDPSGEFQQAFVDALNIWTNTSTFRFNTITTSAIDPCAANPGGNGVLFQNDNCGDAFGSTTLAIQTAYFSGSTRTRTGIVFNNTKSWAVFSTPFGQGVNSGKNDVYRVAVHELGHSIGLGHEDVIAPAIMRSSVGSVRDPQSDDIAGVAAMYDTDNDGVGKADDNCPTVSNADQANVDGDSLGNACDDDIDGDGVYDAAARDQSFGIGAANGFIVGLGSGSNARAQTFTAGISGTLKSVSAPLNCDTGSGLTVSIHTLSGANPSTTVLGSVTVNDLSSLPRDAAGFEIIDFNSESVAIVSASQYAIVVDSNASCSWSLASPSNYSGGTARSSSNRTSWFALNFGNGSEDLPFTTKVTPSVFDNCPLVVNPSQADGDSDGMGDACDTSNGDADGDGIDDALDNCPAVPNPNQANFDNDDDGDLCDTDIDNDGALNNADANDMNPLICSDNDADMCDDCSSGSFSVANDGLDTDSDGACNVGDTDDDGDSVLDNTDNCPLLENTNQANFDMDDDGDVCDADIDNDGALNGADTNDTNPLICSDNDGDMCDDCSSGSFNLALDGEDTDSNGMCDVGDTDDDGDGIPDNTDNCSLTDNPDQANLDNDAEGDVCDSDADGDMVPVGADSNDLDPRMCSDNDGDFCDDCSSGLFNTANDGLDSDSNGICNLGDADDDGDTIDDAEDNCPLVMNLDQLDGDENGIGDVCEESESFCIPLILDNGGGVLICL